MSSITEHELVMAIPEGTSVKVKDKEDTGNNKRKDQIEEMELC